MSDVKLLFNRYLIDSNENQVQHAVYPVISEK